VCIADPAHPYKMALFLRNNLLEVVLFTQNGICPKSGDSRG
jgi:hypothetical protein